MPKIWNKYSQKKELRGFSPNFHIHVFVSDLYIPTIAHRHMEIWTEAAQFLFWEYSLQCRLSIEDRTWRKELDPELDPDQDSDPDPTPDPTPFFIDFTLRMQKNICFILFWVFSLKNLIFAKILC
jgi:hypothetical protein